MIDSATYPRLRPKRIGGEAGAPVLSPVPLPRTRVFTFLLREQAQLRQSVSMARCQGPALIKDLEVYESTLATTYAKCLEIGYSTVPVSENGVALTTPRPYTPLTELVNLGVTANAGGAGLEYWAVPNNNPRVRPLELIVDLPEFYVVLAWFNNTLNAQDLHGMVRVVEGIDRAALANFL